MKPIHSGLGIVTAVVSAGLLISLVACSAKLKNQGPDQGCTDSACGTGGAGGSGSASAAGASGASGSDSADPESGSNFCVWDVCDWNSDAVFTE